MEKQNKKMDDHTQNLFNALMELANKKPKDVCEIAAICLNNFGGNVKSVSLKGEKKIKRLKLIEGNKNE